MQFDQLKRREFITLIGGAAATWPNSVGAQQSTLPVIAFLSPGFPEADVSRLNALRQGLKETGYVESQNVAIQYRWARSKYDQLPALAADLVARQVSVLVTVGTPATLVAKAATNTIPIVVVTMVDQPGMGSTLGADEYLVKPIERATLIAAVERCIRLRGGRPPAQPILVVEDHDTTRELIIQVLNGCGYAVQTAADGAEAQASVNASPPALVILDLLLPKLSGFDLIAAWRTDPRTADLPIFVLTSKDLTPEETRYLRSNAEFLVRKDHNWKETLIKQLQRAIPQHQLEMP